MEEVDVQRIANRSDSHTEVENVACHLAAAFLSDVPNTGSVAAVTTCRKQET